MDKIKKFLRRLNNKQRTAVLKALYNIRAGELDGLDVVKLTGRHKMYRARVGRVRIQFIEGEKENAIISVEYRSDKTYKKIS